MSWGNLLLLAVVSYAQNMAFTWSSRSRNSGSPEYHRYAALCSNGVWFIAQIFVLSAVWQPLMAGDWKAIALVGLVYTVSTTEGSVRMMRVLLAREKGKRKVGASSQ